MLIQREMVIKIAERLDCYSILQLTKVSRIFRATLLPIIHQFCSYSVAHYDKMNVVVVPGGDAYGAYTNNDMHFLWKKVELPSHVIVKKAKPGLSCSYLMCKWRRVLFCARFCRYADIY